MKKKRQLYTALGAALVLLAAYLLFSPSEQPGEASASGQEAVLPDSWKLTEMDEADLQSLTMENNGNSFTLWKEGDQWIIREKQDLKLDPQRISRLVSSAIRVTSFDRISEDVSAPEEYGLDAGAASVTLRRTDGTETALFLGSENPSGSARYVRKDDEPAIYLLSSYMSRQLLIDTDALRDRSLPMIDPQTLAYMKIEADRVIEAVPFFQFEPFASSLSPFLMVQPYNRPVPMNSEKISEGLESLFSGLSIVSFVEEGTPPSVTGLGSSARSLYLKDQGGNELALLIGTEKENGEVYCTIPGTDRLFTLGKETLRLIEMPAFELTDRFVRLVGIDLVDGLEVRSGSKTWQGEIKRIDEETEEYFFQGQPVEEDPFKNMYQEVLYLLFEGELTGPFDPGEPRVTIEYRGNSDNPGTTRADFFDYNRDFFAVGIDGFPPEFLIGKYQLDNLLGYLEVFPAGLDS